MSDHSATQSESSGPPSGHAGRHLWQIRWVRDLVLIALVLFLIWFGYYLRSIFTPLLIALTLAYVFNPLIGWAVRRTRMSRPAVIGILLALLLIIVLGAALLLGPMLYDQTGDFLGDIPDYLETLAERIGLVPVEPDPNAPAAVDSAAGEVTAANGDEASPAYTFERLREDLDEYAENPSALLAPIGRWAFGLTGTVAGLIGSVIGTVLYLVMSLVLIPVYFFFIAWQFEPMVKSVHAYLPASRRDRILEVVGKMDSAVSAFIRARLLIAMIMGVLFSVGWCICGVPYWFGLGMGTGLLGLIPYASAIGWPVAILLAWLDRASGVEPAGFSFFMVIFWPSIVYIVVQGVEGWVLTPWIQGRSLEMGTVTLLIVVFIGAAVGGLYGLILCVPVAACIKILLTDVCLPTLKKWATEQ